jgi:hypothetical protein
MVAALLMPTALSAQKLERTKKLEVGDKVTWNFVIQGRSMRVVDEVVQVTDTEVRSIVRVGEKSLEQTRSPADLSWRKGFCESDGKACTRTPPWAWVAFPLEKGRAWSGTSTVTGETFIAEIDYEYKVDGVEKVTTPAGQFDTFRVSGSERIASRSKKEGEWGPLNGISTITNWIAPIKGKVTIIKSDYRNTFGEAFTRELVAAEFK